MTTNIDIITDQTVETLLKCRDKGLITRIQCSILIDELYDLIDSEIEKRPATLEEIRWNLGNQQDEK